MSADSTARTALGAAEAHYFEGGGDASYYLGVAQVRATIAAADALDRIAWALAPGPCGHTLGTQCPGCDHAAHRGSACLARVIAAAGGEEMCQCRFDEEAAPAPVSVLCATCSGDGTVAPDPGTKVRPWCRACGATGLTGGPQ